MSCSFDNSKVCSDMPLKSTHLLQQPLLDTEGSGEHRELSGNEPGLGLMGRQVPLLLWSGQVVCLVGKQNGAGWPTSLVLCWEKKHAWILALVHFKNV